MEQIGPYRTQDELGRGGMGVVYRAQGPMGETVALKVLLPGRGASDRARKRFELEVEALTRLRHPGIVPFLACGQHEGTPWVALEFVEGETLTARLRRGPPTVAEAIEWGRQLAAALVCVHGEGLLHRDLKPDNVLLRDGCALLTDFGLALDTGDEGSRLTQTGIHVGTPGFWAPEQGRGDPRAHGPWTDVYGLGAVLYACLTGSPPVRGRTLQACMASGQFEQIVPPSTERAQVPGWLSAVVMRCLSADPARRPSLAAVLSSLTRAKDLTQPGRGLPVVAGALVVLAALAVGLALAVVLRSSDGGGGGTAAVDSGDVEASVPPPELPLCFSFAGQPEGELDSALALYEPWCFSRDSEGLRLLAQRPARPELLVPLQVDEGSWSLRARISRVALVDSGYVGAWLASFPNREAPGGEDVPWRAVGWQLDLEAGVRPRLRLLHGVKAQRSGLAPSLVLDADPRLPLSVDLRWEPPLLRVEVSGPDGPLGALEGRLDPDDAPRGPSAVRVGQLWTNTLPSMGDAFGGWAQGRVELTLEELTLRGGSLALDPERLLQLRYREGQLGWWLASGHDPDGLQRAIGDLKRVSFERPARRLLPYLVMWLRLRAGDVDDAVRQLTGVIALNRGYYAEPKRWTDVYNWGPNRIQADLPLYPAELLARLDEVYPDLPSLQDALETALRPPKAVTGGELDSPAHARARAWLEVTLHLLAEGSEIPPLRAEPLYRAGLFGRADAALRGAPAPSSDHDANWRGWFAFEEQRYREALELWPPPERDSPGRARGRAYAERWAK